MANVRGEDVQIVLTDRDAETKLVMLRAAVLASKGQQSAGFQPIQSKVLDAELFLVGPDRIELAATFSHTPGHRLLSGLAARIQAPPDLDRSNSFVAVVFYVPGGFGLRLFSLATNSEEDPAAARARAQRALAVRFGVSADTGEFGEASGNQRSVTSISFRFGNLVQDRKMEVFPLPVDDPAYFQTVLTQKQLVWHVQALCAQAGVNLSRADTETLLGQAVLAAGAGDYAGPDLGGLGGLSRIDSLSSQKGGKSAKDMKSSKSAAD